MTDKEDQLDILDDRHGNGTTEQSDSDNTDSTQSTTDESNTSESSAEETLDTDETVSSTDLSLPDPDSEELEDVVLTPPDMAEEPSGWSPQTLYLLSDSESEVLGDVHNEFNNLFFMRLRLQNEDLQDKSKFMKRVLQQAALEVGMSHPTKVVDRAFQINDEVDQDTDTFDPLTVYLQEDVHSEFNDLWFMRLKLKFPELQQEIGLHRILQQAVVEVAMETPGEVAERAREITDRF